MQSAAPCSDTAATSGEAGDIWAPKPVEKPAEPGCSSNDQAASPDQLLEKSANSTPQKLDPKDLF
jgi:hypothetical protein